MSIILRFYPNGEFTQGISAPPPKKRRDRTQPSNADITADIKDAYLQWEAETRDSGESVNLYVPGREFKNHRGDTYTYLCHDSEGHHFALEAQEGCYPDIVINEPIGRMVARDELVPLVHQSLESSPAPKTSRKKLTSMTGNMARNIRNGVFLLEENYGKDQLSFLTLTLPDLSKDDISKVCRDWDRMTDQILKWLRKQLHSKGIEFEYVYCTEIQTKRLKKRHEYAPHLHIVFRGRNGKKTPWVITPIRVRKAWANIIAGIVAHRDFTTSALENLQRIKYSASRYLAKYLSKGKNCSPCTDAENEEFGLHTQWGGMARIVARQIKSAIQRFTANGSLGEFVVEFTRRMEELVLHGLLRYAKRRFVPFSGNSLDGSERGIWVAVGCLQTPTHKAGLLPVFEYLVHESAV